MNKYRLSKLKRKLRHLLIVFIIFGAIFFALKGWFKYTKETVSNAVKSNEDLFSSEEFKEKTEDVTHDVINSIVTNIFKLSEKVDETASSFVEDLNNAVEDAKGNGEDVNVEEDTKTLHKVELWCIIDGDTLNVIDNGNSIKVRLIGINTPESVHANEELNTVYGKEASVWVETYLTDNGYLYGQPLYLEYDVSDKDIYDRTLAYVWLKEDVDTNNENDIRNYMLNSLIVLNGYAEDVVYEPNHKYADYFNAFFNEAKEQKAGLWKYEDFHLFEGINHG